MLFVMFFETLQAREHGGVFFRLVLFGAEGVVAEWIEADCGVLVGREGFGEDGAVKGDVNGRWEGFWGRVGKNLKVDANKHTDKKSEA